ncbi:MAG TPA: hypothetical protein VFK88_02565 [Gallionella sp.]|nr:hypothetical protein [Gallionella sp.]
MVIRQTGALRRTVRSRYWLVLALLSCSPATAVEVIVNSDVAVQSITQNTLRAIFTMHMRQWPNGKPIKVFVLPETNMVHASFAKEVLHTFPYQLKRSWDVLVFSGSGQAPTVANSPGEMLQKVSSTPGAIGYLPNDYLIEGIKNENIHLLEPR